MGERVMLVLGLYCMGWLVACGTSCPRGATARGDVCITLTGAGTGAVALPNAGTTAAEPSKAGTVAASSGAGTGAPAPMSMTNTAMLVAGAVAPQPPAQSSMAFCGNKLTETGETCDGPNCPTGCDDGDPCTQDQLTGSAAECSATCVHTLITATVGGDGCCPSGANAGVDNDCSKSCGDGVVSDNETCEPQSSKPCPNSCDDGDACTDDVLTGTAQQCNVVCSHPAKLSTASKVCGDGRCLPASACCGNEECAGNHACSNDACSPSQCKPGFKACGDGSCVSQTGCCTDSECSSGFACSGGACSNACRAGFVDCGNGACIERQGACVAIIYDVAPNPDCAAHLCTPQDRVCATNKYRRTLLANTSLDALASACPSTLESMRRSICSDADIKRRTDSGEVITVAYYADTYGGDGVWQGNTPLGEGACP